VQVYSFWLPATAYSLLDLLATIEGMRIIVDTRLLNRGENTGIPQYLREILPRIMKMNPDSFFTLFSNSFSRNDSLSELIADQKNQIVINKRIPNRILSLAVRLLGRPAIENLTNESKADLIWSPHLDLLAQKNTPRVITVHDISFLHFPNFFSFKYHLWSWLQNQKRQIINAQHIIAVSQYTKNDIVKTVGVNPEKITVIYPGISESFYPMSSEDENLLRFKKTHSLNNPFILFLGTLEKRKNLSCLIKGFSEFKKNPEFKNYELVLAGKPGFGFSEIKKCIALSKYSNSIRLIHNIKNEERVYLYNSARVFVFPSFFEGFGFPPLEAQACGIPVASSLRGSLGEVLRETAKEIDPFRPTSLATALKEIETDENLRNRMIQLGKENAKKFSWKDAASKTSNCFRSLISR
jgi:glycosyltransferase involved in cell wall biosynthesis